MLPVLNRDNLWCSAGQILTRRYLDVTLLEEAHREAGI